MSSNVLIDFIWFGHLFMVSSTCLQKQFMLDLHPCPQHGPWSVSLVILDQKFTNLLTHIKTFLNEDSIDAKSMLLLYYFLFLITHPKYFLNILLTLEMGMCYFKKKKGQEDF